LNLAENHQPVIELYQTADHPALSPKSGSPEWRVATADEFGGFWITMWKTRGKYLPYDLAGGSAHFLSGYSFLMISSNLLDFWAMFFLILSCYGTLHLLLVFRT
jgi:hypothetical protein